MVRRSFLFSFIDKYSGIALNLATTAIVSRILTPAEVGLFMVTSAIVILIETFRDFGVGACIVQDRDSTPALVRTAFTVMALLSALFAGVLALAAAPLAAFYGNAALAPMIRVATIAFILAPVSNPLLALMRRDMAFDRVAWINITAALVNTAGTIGLALLGFGPLSFVWASVMASAAVTVSVVVARPALWVFRPTLSEWRTVIPFGAWSSIVTLLGILFDFLPRFILGRVLSFGAVGLYSRAASLCQLPERAMISALQPVILSTMAARARGGEDLKAPYLLGLANLSGVQWPALACLALLADPIIRGFLGDQWLGSVPLVRIMAVASLSLFPVYLSFPTLVSIGRMKDMVTASLVALPPCLLAILAASRIGLDAVAASLFLTGPFQAYVFVAVIRRHIPFTWGEVARAARPSATATLCTILLPLAVISLSPSHFALTLPQAGIASIGAALGWLAGLRLAGHPLDSEIRRGLGVVRHTVLRIRRRAPLF